MRLKTLFIEIILKEDLRTVWADEFPELTFSPTEDERSRLCGEIADYAALHGLLERIRDLNLRLVSLQVDEIDNQTPEISGEES